MRLSLNCLFWRPVWRRPPPIVDGGRIDHVEYFAGEAGLPEQIPKGVVAIVGPATRPKWALLQCPCGHDHLIRLSLSPTKKPWWRVTLDRAGRPTLTPSVDVREPHRRCHFLLIRGQIHWASSHLDPPC